MDSFDVVIAGAGPAGGQAARLLSKKGFKTLLLEKAPSFSSNDFSSGGAPLEILDDFNLPHTLVGAYCNTIKISSSHDTHCWQTDMPLAVVLNFKKLRTFLADETKKQGASVYMGCSYQGHDIQNGHTLVHLKQSRNSVIETVEAKVLMDATGSDRRVLKGRASPKTPSNNVIVGRGIEYLVEVPESVYHTYANALSFYIGAKWMPQGYAWIFPMEAYRLKIGVGRNYPDEQVVPHEKSMGFYLDQLIRECLKIENLSILDKHGKTIVYTRHQRDPYLDQNIIAVGDAVSTVNPFTFEGIRHALKSGEFAARHVQTFLETGQQMNRYPSQIRSYFGIKWVISELLTDKIYREPDDEKMNTMLRAFKYLSLSALKSLVFDYSFKSAIQFYAAYHFLLVRRFFGQIWKRHTPIKTQ